MNIEKLLLAEKDFMDQYPGGFQNPEMVEISKKHKVGKMTEMARDFFSEEGFGQPDILTENMIKIVTRSSLISVFEKPRFRDFIRSLNSDQKDQITEALYQMIHGNHEKGFTKMVDFLTPFKLAKWTLLTICPAYYRPRDEIYVKPTTTKGILNYFEIQDLVYKPRPSWDFYSRYRDVLDTMKGYVHSSLQPDNPAFTGFLMCMLPPAVSGRGK